MELGRVLCLARELIWARFAPPKMLRTLTRTCTVIGYPTERHPGVCATLLIALRTALCYFCVSISSFDVKLPWVEQVFEKVFGSLTQKLAEGPLRSAQEREGEKFFSSFIFLS